MDIQEIEVTIKKDGQVTLQVMGLKGNACLALTSDLEQALGNLILERQMTSESSEVPPSPIQQKQAPRVRRKRS